jgi:putative membrane protein
VTPQQPVKSLIDVEIIEPVSIAPIPDVVKLPEGDSQRARSSVPPLIHIETLKDTSLVSPQPQASIAAAPTAGANAALSAAKDYARSALKHPKRTVGQDAQKLHRARPEVTPQQSGKPLIEVEIIAPASAAPSRNTGNLPEGAARRAGPSTPPLIQMETLEDADLVNPQPEVPATDTQLHLDDLRKGGHRGAGWLLGLLLIGVVGMTLVGMAEWILGLLEHLPVLGVPAALAAAALGAAAIGLTVREVGALRRLRDVEQVRSAWEGADGERLRQLIIRVGTDVGDTAGARRAADLVDDAGPDAARGLLSREVLASHDLRASMAVASAARQGAVIVVASPSPFLDVILLLGLALRLLRQIAVVYGYRPGTLALRSLALSAWRDAGAIALADVLAQAAMQSGAESIAKVGSSMTAIGTAATTTGVGALVGIPLVLAGAAFTAAPKALGPAGGPLGEGAATAWRLYRFGLIVLVAARPVPFDTTELKKLKASTRAKVIRINVASDGGHQEDGSP